MLMLQSNSDINGQTSQTIQLLTTSTTPYTSISYKSLPPTNENSTYLRKYVNVTKGSHLPNNHSNSTTQLSQLQILTISLSINFLTNLNSQKFFIIPSYLSPNKPRINNINIENVIIHRKN